MTLHEQTRTLGDRWTGALPEKWCWNSWWIGYHSISMSRKGWLNYAKLMMDTISCCFLQASCACQIPTCGLSLTIAHPLRFFSSRMVILRWNRQCSSMSLSKWWFPWHQRLSGDLNHRTYGEASTWGDFNTKLDQWICFWKSLQKLESLISFNWLVPRVLHRWWFQWPGIQESRQRVGEALLGRGNQRHRTKPSPMVP